MNVADDQLPLVEESDRFELAEIASESLAVPQLPVQVRSLNDWINLVACAGEMRFIVNLAPHQIFNDRARYGHAPRRRNETISLVVYVAGRTEALLSHFEHRRKQRRGDLADADHLAPHLSSQAFPVLGDRHQAAISRLN